MGNSSTFIYSEISNQRLVYKFANFIKASRFHQRTVISWRILQIHSANIEHLKSTAKLQEAFYITPHGQTIQDIPKFPYIWGSRLGPKVSYWKAKTRIQVSRIIHAFQDYTYLCQCDLSVFSQLRLREPCQWVAALVPETVALSQVPELKVAEI